MKVFVKCEFYLMILFVDVLLTVGTVASDDQTNCIYRRILRKWQKNRQIMILGSGHLANPGMDGSIIKWMMSSPPNVNTRLNRWLTHLKEFKPTKIAVELQIQAVMPTLKTNYRGYLEGMYELKRGERDQIGFRLAKQMGHPKMYCVDYWPEHNPFFPDDFDLDLIDPDKFAKEHNQEHLLPSIEDLHVDSDVEFHEEEDGRGLD